MLSGNDERGMMNDELEDEESPARSSFIPNSSIIPNSSFLIHHSWARHTTDNHETPGASSGGIVGEQFPFRL
jgi:hypothetical protein